MPLISLLNLNVTVYGSNTMVEGQDADYAAELSAVLDEGDDVAATPPSYTDILRDYAADTWEDVKSYYLDHDMSGIDRAQDRIAATVADYQPELDNPYAEAVAENAVEFGRSFGQAVAGAFTSPAALYDAAQELREADRPPVSPYVHIEEYRDGEGSVAEAAGKAAGFATGAVAGVQYPFLFLAGAAHTGRHLAERAAHHYLRDRVQADDDLGDGELDVIGDAVRDAAVDGYMDEAVAS